MMDRRMDGSFFGSFFRGCVRVDVCTGTKAAKLVVIELNVTILLAAGAETEGATDANLIYKKSFKHHK